MRYIFCLLVWCIGYVGQAQAQELFEVYHVEEKNEVFFPVNGLLDRATNYVSEEDNDYFVGKEYVTQAYAKQFSKEDRYYIRLEEKMNKKLLKDINLPKDTYVYYYNYYYNESYRIPVSELKTIAVLNEYDLEEGADLSYDAGLAFDVALLPNIKSNYGYAMIAVGKEDPFVKKGDVRPVTWTELVGQKSLLPMGYIKKVADKSYCGADEWKLLNMYKSEYNKYDLYLYNMSGKNGCYVYFLAIVKRNSDIVVHSQLFVDGEATYNNPINPEFREEVDQANYQDVYNRMRIGTFLQSGAVSFWGVQSYSFGCSQVFNLGGSPMTVACINNH